MQQLSPAESVDALDLSIRSANVLMTLKVTTIGQLVGLSEADLLKVDGCTRDAVDEIKELLGAYGHALKA